MYRVTLHEMMKLRCSQCNREDIPFLEGLDGNTYCVNHIPQPTFIECDTVFCRQGAIAICNGCLNNFCSDHAEHDCEDMN